MHNPLLKLNDKTFCDAFISTYSIFNLNTFKWLLRDVFCVSAAVRVSDPSFTSLSNKCGVRQSVRNCWWESASLRTACNFSPSSIVAWHQEERDVGVRQICVFACEILCANGSHITNISIKKPHWFDSQCWNVTPQIP